MIRNKGLLTDYEVFETPEKVGLGNGCTVDAFGIGNVHLKMLPYSRKVWREENSGNSVLKKFGKRKVWRVTW